MLKKFIGIRNVGRFISSALPPLPTCAKYTLIFGANGSGKTTLCAILRSLATNDPKLVIGRTRVGGVGAAKIELLLDSGPAVFENSAWSVSAPQVTIFDGTFVAENVHSGDAVDLEQKRNLYRVIVGKEGVGLAFEEERLAAESRKKASDINTLEKAIQSHVPQGMKLEQFVKLPADPEIDAKIGAQTRTLEAVREAAQIKARAGLTLVASPAFPLGFEELLDRTLEGIAEDAQVRIAEHIKHHGMGPESESWIAEGVQHLTDEECPFCGQSVDGLALVEAYRKVFADEYKQMKTAVADMQSAIASDFGDRRTGSIETLMESNRGGVEFWGRYCALPKVDPPAQIAKALSAVKNASDGLLSKKSAAPQEAVALDGTFRAALEQYQSARTAIEAYNAAVQAANQAIAEKRIAIAGTDVKQEEALLVLLNAQRRRHDPKVDQLCSTRAVLLQQKDGLDAKKGEVRGKLEEHTKKVIKPYEKRINQFLDSFNAGFQIAETKAAYPGGVSSSTYQLVINNTGIELGDGATPLDRPSFKNTLSAGDKSTLALALFLAHLERDPDRAKRIVVFDDPFTSQDSFRRRQTINEITKVATASEQTIVLSHDATFLRHVRDKCPTAERASLQLADHRALGIKVVGCDLDEACKGRAASEMDDLQAYMATGAGKDRDIIKKMRIVLETHCRSTFPGSFETSDRLGGMVEKIKKVGDAHPAWALVGELEEINEYSREHHHGEDPKDGSADIIDAQELAGFVKRTLRVVNNLQA